MAERREKGQEAGAERGSRKQSAERRGKTQAGDRDSRQIKKWEAEL